MLDDTLSSHFPVASFLSYYNHPHNAPHHVSGIGPWIEYGQSFVVTGVQHYTHISLIEGFDPEPAAPGFNHAKIIDVLKNQKVSIRALEHNYGYRVFYLRPDLFVHPTFSSKMLAEKAIKVAKQLIGSPYHRGTLSTVLWVERKIDSSYLSYLANRLHINFEAQSVHLSPDGSDGFICAEFAMLCYQAAWLLLAGPEGLHQSLPPCLSLHALCSPAALTKHLMESKDFIDVPDEWIEKLRYSGTPDPRDPPRATEHPLRMSGVKHNEKKPVSQPIEIRSKL